MSKTRELQPGREILPVTQENFHVDSLDDFSRHQVVKNMCRVVDGELQVVYAPYVKDWDARKRRDRAAEILSGQYVVYCVFEEGRVLGLVMLVPALDDGRMIIEHLLITDGYRRQGLGSALLEKAKEEGRQRGARSLYISACPSEETIHFYQAMGCILSPQPMAYYVQKNPNDVQMECPL